MEQVSCTSYRRGVCHRRFWHLVAYDDILDMKDRTPGGIAIAMKSGEGMVVELTGPGRVWTQSRNPNELIGWLATVLPFTRA